VANSVPVAGVTEIMRKMSHFVSLYMAMDMTYLGRLSVDGDCLLDCYTFWPPKYLPKFRSNAVLPFSGSQSCSKLTLNQLSVAMMQDCYFTKTYSQSV